MGVCPNDMLELTLFPIFTTMCLCRSATKHMTLETCFISTICPGSSDPFYIVSYYIKWVTTSWTYSIDESVEKRALNPQLVNTRWLIGQCCAPAVTVCPRSSDPFYIVSYYINWVNTSWTHSINHRYISIFLYIDDIYIHIYIFVICIYIFVVTMQH